MGMTIAVTRDVAQRVRGFLASTMSEIAPGVYAAPRLNPQVRQRILAVLHEWQAELGGGVTLMWEQKSAVGGLGLATIGAPARELVELDGLFLSRTELTAAEQAKLAGWAISSLKTEHFSTGHPGAPAPQIVVPTGDGA